MTDIIDTHCHPQDRKYDADRDEVIRRALDAGVGMVCVGVDLESSRQAIELSEQYEGVYASVGLHPNDNLDESYDEREYAKLAEHPRVVAIGEIGLDYYRTTDPGKRLFQKERFERQLALARRLSKPVIIHCRDAHEDMLAMIGDGPGVIHSFNGNVEQAARYIEKGWHLGLNAIVTYAPEYHAMVKSIPKERILLETDAPYLAPAPHRGKRNEPVYIKETAEAIAKVRGEDLNRFLKQCFLNSIDLGLFR